MWDNLKQRTAKGFAWGLLNQGSTQLLNFAFGIVLARQLTRADYGIVGVLTVFTLVAGNLQACGFTQGLCNMEKPEHKDYNSVFWFNISMSACLYVLLFLCAPLIADFFGSPELVAVSRLVFLTLPISAVSTIAGAYMFKNMMVRENTIVGDIALLCSGTVGITLAFLDYNYWALAWQQVVYSTIVTISRYCLWPFRLSVHFTFDTVRRLFPFSVKMMLTTVLNSLSQQILTVLFARHFPMATVGSYSQANKWNTMASGMLQGTISQIAQPVMAEIRDDEERSLRVLRKMVRFTAFFSFPAMFGLALVAEEFILTTIGDEWLPCVDILRVLAIAGSTLPIYALLQNTAISRGRSDLYLWLNVVQIAVQIGIVEVLQNYPIEYMVIATSVFTLLFLFVWHAFTRKLTADYSLVFFLKDILPFALPAAFTMLITWWVTDCVFASLHFSFILIIRIVLAAVIYAAIMYCSKAEIMRECMRYVKQVKSAKHE